MSLSPLFKAFVSDTGLNMIVSSYSLLGHIKKNLPRNQEKLLVPTQEKYTVIETDVLGRPVHGKIVKDQVGLLLAFI